MSDEIKFKNASSILFDNTKDKVEFVGCFTTEQPPLKVDEDMTLRDFFAGSALQGLIRGYEGKPGEEITADYAYRYADAMLKERSKVKK